MKIIRIVCFGLALLLTFLPAMGCKSKNEPDDDNNVEQSSLSNEESTTENYIARLSNKYDYNQYEFKVMVPAAEAHMPDSGPAMYGSEEISGEIVNDAIYMRNRKVEEALNIKINVFEHSPGGIGDTYNAVAKSIQSNDDTFDVVIPHILLGPEALALNGYLADWNSISSVDFSNPWWRYDAVKSFTVAGKSFFGISEFNFGNMGNTYAMFFNKDFVERYNLENPYDLVRTKKWTVDKVLEMIANMYNDLNGNGEVDPNDLFGYSGSNTGCLLGFMYGANITYFKTDSEGMPQVSFNNEKTNILIDKIISIYYEGNRSYIYGNNEIDIFKAMQEERMFLQADKIGEIIKLRDFDLNFGILPYPLYDENQEKYHTYVDAWGGVLCLPSNMSDDGLERAAVILDALSYETMINVKPKYYDIALKTKYARDEESSEMLDLIYDGLLFDLGYVYDNQATYWLLFPNNVNVKKNQFASSMERLSSSITKYIDKVYTAVSNIE